MPWYKAGTVSVVQNSNAVTGNGTSFIANARVGDAFRGPDGGWYEVTNIASDTAMSISPNYQGASSSAGAYALAPMQGYVKDSADALRALVNQFGGVLAVLGTTPTLAGVRTALNLTDTSGLQEGTNKYFSDARVRAAVLTGLVSTDASDVAAADSILGALGKLQAKAAAAVISIGNTNTAVGNKANKGANNDITSLLGLTTPLSPGQGGTGNQLGYVAHRRALVSMASGQSIANASVTPVVWGATNDAAVWTSANPTRLIVPANCTKLRLTAQAGFSSNATGERYVTVGKNGAFQATVGFGQARFNADSAPSARTDVNCISAIVDVVPGDYFELGVYQTSGGALVLTAANLTWIAMELWP